MKINKFYHSARHIAEAISEGRNASCTFEDLELCIKNAEYKVQRGEVDSIAIVQIIKIVRKDFPPTIVEDVE